MTRKALTCEDGHAVMGRIMGMRARPDHDGDPSATCAAPFKGRGAFRGPADQSGEAPPLCGGACGDADTDMVLMDAASTLPAADLYAYGTRGDCDAILTPLAGAVMAGAVWME